MDFQQAQDHRGEGLRPEPDGRRRAARKRAQDARLRRAIREAFAHQRSGGEPRPDAARLRVVRPPQP